MEYETVIRVQTYNVGALDLGRDGGVGTEDVGMSNNSMQLQPHHLITSCILEIVRNGNNPGLSVRRKGVFGTRFRLSFLFYKMQELN